MANGITAYQMTAPKVKTQQQYKTTKSIIGEEETKTAGFMDWIDAEFKKQIMDAGRKAKEALAQKREPQTLLDKLVSGPGEMVFDLMGPLGTYAKAAGSAYSTLKDLQFQEGQVDIAEQLAKSIDPRFGRFHTKGTYGEYLKEAKSAFKGLREEAQDWDIGDIAMKGLVTGLGQWAKVSDISKGFAEPLGKLGKVDEAGKRTGMVGDYLKAYAKSATGGLDLTKLGEGAFDDLIKNIMGKPDEKGVMPKLTEKEKSKISKLKKLKGATQLYGTFGETPGEIPEIDPRMIDYLLQYAGYGQNR